MMFEFLKKLIGKKTSKQSEDIRYIETLKPQIGKGRFDLFGVNATSEGIIFTVYVKDAEKVELALFDKGQMKPDRVVAFPEECILGDVYSMLLYGLEADTFEYTFIKNGTEYFLDPYAKEVSGYYLDEQDKKDARKQYRGGVVSGQFDWQGVKNPRIPMSDLIIYEAHVGGYTEKGTFGELMKKIPYLKNLGINAIELMPIFSFDAELDTREHNGMRLGDFWGYNPINFFSPNRKYYSESVNELKELVRELHRNGIEVIMDVVYNHTAEGGHGGYPINYKISDKQSHYILGHADAYHNYSGCGNTLNCNNPIVKRMILDSVRYWVSEYKIDGFRFDLASILTRGEYGQELSDPPVVKELALDPILKHTKLIAEAWDTGLYQVGRFPSYMKWVEWNGKYRDSMREFLKGDDGVAHDVIERINGSLDIYHKDFRKDASINFITCHDGFTLHDLYSYNDKHNEANGWNNSDGDNNNHSWNCGFEGETKDKKVLELRRKMVKNAIMALLSSRGVPMLLAGDEFGRTQQGNNNAYCQDNEISWIDWKLLSKNKDLFEFTRKMIVIRKEHPVMKRIGKHAQSGHFHSISHHGIKAWHLGDPDVHKFLGIMFAGRNVDDTEDDFVYVAMNVRHIGNMVELPILPEDYRWKVALSSDEVILRPDSILLPDRTFAICVSERVDRKLWAYLFKRARKKRSERKKRIKR